MPKPIGQVPVPERVLPTAVRLTPSLGALTVGEATSRVAPGDFEQALRTALAELKDAFTQVQAEGDPLSRHLGLRQLAEDVGAREWDVSHLSRREEQDYARDLVRDVVTLASQSAERLDAQARTDLDAILRFEARQQERAALETQRDAASRAEARDVARRERLQRDIAQAEARLAALPPQPRPAWHRGAGVGLVLCALVALVLAWSGPVSAGPPVPRGAWGLAAVVLGAVGAWLVRDRRAALRARLAGLLARSQETDAEAARSKEALARALALFGKVDAECRAEEAAAEAVLHRRPGAARYVRRAPASAAPSTPRSG
jgi:hypothetical protein